MSQPQGEGIQEGAGEQEEAGEGAEAGEERWWEHQHLNFYWYGLGEFFWDNLQLLNPQTQLKADMKHVWAILTAHAENMPKLRERLGVAKDEPDGPKFTMNTRAYDEFKRRGE